MFKKVLYLVFFAALFSFTKPIKAGHVLGGEITWECLTSGKYIFYTSVYVNCSQGAATWVYNSTSLRVVGSPLPRNENNQFISSIPMQPDSIKWQNNRNGDLTPLCNVNDTNQISCGAPGTTRAYYYKSAPVTLKGVPPANAWTFIYDPPCCRPDLENIVNSTTRTMDLRAKMYPTANNQNTDPCIDSSPEFSAVPWNMICRGSTFTYNPTIIDKDLDSIVYAWDRSYDTYPTQPTQYQSPQYDFDNPTPDASFNANNIGATIDPISDMIKLEVHSGSGKKSYLTVIRADAYRDGVRIASVFREIPFIFFDCPPLPSGPGWGNRINNPPDIFIGGVLAEDTIVDVVAGQKLKVPFQATDYDYAGQNGTGLQTVTVVPDGFMFSQNLTNPTFCQIVGVAPCAYLQNQAPTLNTIVSPPRREISGLAVVSTELVWETQCFHIRSAGTGIPGQQQSIYNFVMKTFDDHCPIPGVKYPTISVRLTDPLPLTAPIMKGASVDLDGHLTYSWTPPLDSAFSFNRYASEFNSPNDGNLPSFWQNLRANVTNYHKERFEPGFQFFAPLANGQPNILHKRPGVDWYFRMHTESGCSGNEASQPSEAVQVMEVESTPAGQAPSPARSTVRLDWNRPKPLNANSYSYYEYESPTHFYIWENDSIYMNGQHIGGESVAANWYLRGDTTDTTYTLNTNICNGRAGFRIEARDTVVIRKQGSRLKSGDELDTLIFSTFSIIDTMKMEDRGFIPAPQFDTIMVKENGDVYFRIDRANAGTAGRFRIYEDATTNPPIGNFKSEVDSFLYNGFDGNASVGDFFIGAQDKCNQNIMAYSNLYSTILPNGELLNPTCSLDYELRWNTPQGFTSSIKHFKVYVDSSNTGFQLVKTINNASATSTILNIKKGVDYRFRVIAIDQSNAVNISAVYRDTISANLRSFEIVQAPELLCTNIDSSGEVLITFATPRDTTNNGVEYKFDYRMINGNWQIFSGSSQVNYGVDNQVLITGINAHQNDYEFRARTISGCDGITPSPNSVIISTKGVEVLDQFLDHLYVGEKEALSYQWFDCNSNLILPFGTNKQFVPSDTGTYGVYVEYADCSDTSICYMVDHVLDTTLTQLTYNSIESAELDAYYQWYDCREDTLIPGANSRTFVAEDTGYYAVILRAYGYRDTSACIPMFSVGLDELNFSDQINFYPNPTKGSVTIETGAIQASLQIKVRNIHGQLVQEKQFVNQSNIQFQLTGGAGIYFIELVNAKGERANVKVLKR